MSERFLLDTHVWLWMMNDDLRAHRSRALKQVEKGAQENRVLVSWVSVWEIAMLEADRRITLPVPIQEWIEKALHAPGIQTADLDPLLLIESSRLPGGFHSDPMDCILVATARHLNATLVTTDRKILQYAALKYVKALAF